VAHEFCGENTPAASGRSISRPGRSNPAHLTISAERHGNEIVMRLLGELDASNVEGLRQAMDKILEIPPPTLVVDATGLGFADCAGVSALVAAHERLAGQGRELIIAGPRLLVRRLLAITGLDGILHVRVLGTWSGRLALWLPYPAFPWLACPRETRYGGGPRDG
jgi:anti-sigma B factor antagonist